MHWAGWKRERENGEVVTTTLVLKIIKGDKDSMAKAAKKHNAKKNTHQYWINTFYYCICFHLSSLNLIKEGMFKIHCIFEMCYTQKHKIFWVGRVIESSRTCTCHAVPLPVPSQNTSPLGNKFSPKLKQSPLNLQGLASVPLLHCLPQLKGVWLYLQWPFK